MSFTLALDPDPTNYITLALDPDPTNSSPVTILESCARRVTGSIIITEMYMPELGEGPVCSLVPTMGNAAWDTWWRFTPRFFTQFLEVLGFTDHQVTFHKQQAFGHWHEMFTIVASRPQ